MSANLSSLHAASESESLEGLLSRRLGSRIRGLQVEIRRAGLVLRGWTETFYCKQVAQHAAMDLTGLPIVANEIEVK